MKVHIPFLKQFREPMLTGKKTMTSRMKRYGKKGDTFEAFGSTFVILGVSKVPLGDVVYLHYEEEGFTQRKDLIQCWEKLHPRKGYVPQQEVWVHTFHKEVTA